MSSSFIQVVELGSLGGGQEGFHLEDLRQDVNWVWTLLLLLLVSCFRQDWATELNRYMYFQLPWWLSSKELACQYRRLGYHPWARMISWRRKLQPLSVCMPGKAHEQRGRASYSPQESQRVRHNLTHMYIYVFNLFPVSRVLQNLKEIGKTNFNQIN